LGGNDVWQPTLATEQAPAPVVSISGSTLNWNDSNYVLGWAIFKNDVFVKFTTTNSYDIIGNSGLYTVRAANAMGGLSAKSNAVDAAVLGLDDNTLALDNIVLHPNPTNSTANLQIGGDSEKTELSLYNLIGQKVWSGSAITGNNVIVPISLSGFTNGVYLLKIDKGLTTKTMKIIKE
jgi:hypothetical protein